MISYKEFKEKHPEANLDDYLIYCEDFLRAERRALGSND